MLKSIEFNHHSQKWELHEAEQWGHFVVVGKKLAEFDLRADAEAAAAAPRYLPAGHPDRKY